MKSVVYDVTVVGVLFVALARFLATVSVERRRPSTKARPATQRGREERPISRRIYARVAVSRDSSYHARARANHRRDPRGNFCAPRFVSRYEKSFPLKESHWRNLYRDESCRSSKRNTAGSADKSRKERHTRVYYSTIIYRATASSIVSLALARVVNSKVSLWNGIVVEIARKFPSRRKSQVDFVSARVTDDVRVPRFRNASHHSGNVADHRAHYAVRADTNEIPRAIALS